MKRGKSKFADSEHHVATFLLYTNDSSLKALKSRFYSARCFYNAILGECEKRRRKMATLEEYKKAIALCKEAHNIEDKKASTKLRDEAKPLFEIARRQAGFYLRQSAKNGLTNDIEQYGYKILRVDWITQIDSSSCNELSHRAFEASNKVATRKAKRVRFLRGHEFKCLQGKNSSVKLKLINDKLHLYWYGLTVPLIEDNDDSYLENIKANLKKNNEIIRTVRIIRKLVGSNERFFAQVTCAIEPPEKGRYNGCGEVGIDAGTKEIYYVKENGEFGVVDLCRRLKDIGKTARKQQRKLDRQRRINNPDCFDEKGRFIKGKKLHTFSKRYKVTRTKLADLLRRQVEFKKCLQGEVINQFRSFANVVKREECEYKKWQERKPRDENGNRKRNFGRSIQKSGVGGFIKRLDYRFQCKGNKDGVVSINTYATKLSQTCPVCLTVKKKTLREREHKCDKCGFEWKRDLTSALLALCVERDGKTLDHKKVLEMIEKLAKNGAFKNGAARTGEQV